MGLRFQAPRGTRDLLPGELPLWQWAERLAREVLEHYGYEEGQFPVTDDVARRALTLPLHEWLSADDRELVARTLLDALA